MTTPDPHALSSENREKNSSLGGLVRVLFPIAILLVVVFTILFVIRGSVTSKDVPSPLGENFRVAVGATIPDFEIKKFPDEAVVKFSEIKAKALLVNFWASWCEACMIEMPSIIKLREAFRGQGFDVMAINVDDQPHAAVPGALKEMGGEVPVYTELDGAPLATLLRVSAIPFSVVLDSTGKILYIETGERDWFDEEMKGLVSTWLKP